MRNRFTLLALCCIAMYSQTAGAQTATVEIQDGTNGTRFDSSGNGTNTGANAAVSSVTIRANDGPTNSIFSVDAEGSTLTTVGPLGSSTTLTDQEGITSRVIGAGNTSQVIQQSDRYLVNVNGNGLVVNDAGTTFTGLVSTQGINNGNNVISGVADGVAPTDAVNVRQLNAVAGLQGAALSGLQNQTVENRRMASTGTAIALAASSIPGVVEGKSISMGIGVGGYDGRSAISIGLAARLRANAQVRFNLGTGSGGKTGVGAGGSWSW